MKTIKERAKVAAEKISAQVMEWAITKKCENPNYISETIEELLQEQRKHDVEKIVECVCANRHKYAKSEHLGYDFLTSELLRAIGK